MINGLKPYPAMKDSGVPWLGEVPEHWEIERLKSSVSSVIEQTAERQSGDLYVALEHVESWTGRLRPADSDVTFDSQVKRFRAGDVLFGKLRPYLAKVTRPSNGGVCVGEFFVLRPRGSDSSAPYLEQLLRSKPIIDAVNSSTFGAKMPRADWQFVGGMPITLPPLPEQAAIVRFLDHADRRIRRYIRAKQKLINLLEEQKQAIIHRAVTRGLDPNVRLKPSGVEWLGDVPEHWEVASLRHRYSQVLGKMLDSKRITGESLLPYLRNTDVQWDRINVDGLPQMDIAPAEYERYTVRAGDLLVCEGGEVGRAAIWTGSLPLCGFQKALHRLRPFNPEGDVPRFLYFALRAAAKGNAFSDGHVSTIAHLTGEKLRGHPFPFPPREEQQAIAQWIDGELVNIGDATESTAQQIDLLREYRTRLIADVVTGKLDVREAAARLPDEVEEPKSLDEVEPDGDSDEAGTDDADAVPEEVEA